MSEARRADGSSFALSRDGKRLAVGDGPELLVYRQDGQPVWKHFADGVLVGLGFVGEHLGAVDADGRVTFFRAADGLKLEEVALDVPALGVFTAPDDSFGVITWGGPVRVAVNGERHAFPVQDLRAASYGPDRNSLGLGTGTGTFVSMDGNTGGPWGTLELGGRIDAIAWCAQGFWLVLVGNVLFRVDGPGKVMLGRLELPGPGTQLVCTSDGAIAAVLTPGEPPEQKVTVVELYGHKVVGDVVFRRPIAGIAFGRAALLGVGLDDGDASTVDLLTRATLRTEPHPGRGRNNWNLDMKFDAAPLRGAVTFLRAGGQAIAQYHGPPEEDPAGRSRKNAGCQIAMLVAAMMGFGCLSCAVGAFVLRYVGYL